MSQLDEFLKHKLTEGDPGARFEFREEFWLEAERLIQADEERKRKRRWLFWWWFGAPVLLVSALVAWFWFSENPGDAAKANASVSEQNVPPVGHQRLAAGDAGKEISGEEKFAIGDSTDSKSTAYNSESEAENPTGRLNPAQINLSKKDAQAKGWGNAKSKKNPNSSTRNSTENRSAAAQTPVSAADPGSKNAVSEKGKIPPPEVSVLENSKTAAQNEGQNPAQNRVQNPAPNSDSDFQNLPKTETPGRKIWMEILPILFVEIPFVKNEKRQINIPKIGTPKHVASEEKLTKPIDNQRFAFGAMAMATRHFEDGLDLKNGFSGGVFGKYFFNEKWSAQVGVNYRFRQSTSVDFSDTLPAFVVPVAVQRNYKFGWEDSNIFLEKMNLHRLEIPVSVARNFGKVELEVGLCPSFSMAAKAEVQQLGYVQHEDFQQGTQRFWLKNPPVLKFSVSGFAGASFKLAKRFSAVSRFHWSGKNLRTDYLNDSALAKNNFWLEAGLRWQFSPKMNRK